MHGTDVVELHEATFLAERLLVADPNLQRVREDALLNASRDPGKTHRAPAERVHRLEC